MASEVKSASQVKPQDIEAMIEVFQASDWDELHIEMDGFELFLSNDPKAGLASASPVAAPPVPIGGPQQGGGATPAALAASGAPIGTVVAGDGPVPDTWVGIRAPNLGTFYRQPKPGAAPYCDVGQSVTEDSELCLIEVMKLFTSLRSGVSGVVRRICVADGAMVEYGQILFYIEPA